MKKVLITDDQSGWINFNVQAVLEVLGEEIEIKTASSAREGHSLLLENVSSPFEIIITDMQMEEDYEPKMAGEWLIEQVKSLPQYNNSKIIIISASPRSKFIAENYGVNYIPKSVALTSIEAYKSLLVD